MGQRAEDLLTNVEKARLAETCARYGVQELAVFGSMARGEATVQSDVDLLYVTAPGIRLGFALNRLEDELADVIGRPVDLVSRRAIHSRIRPQAEHDALVLYAA